MPLFAWAGDDNDFGTWLELGAEKKLPQNLSLDLEGELRMSDNSSQVGRIGVSAGLSYKIHKYLKAGVSYSFLEYYKPEKYKDKSKDEIEKDEDGDYKHKVNYGFDKTPSYWRPRHRVNFELNSSVKLGKWLRISVRERYQFTRTTEKTVTTHEHRDKYRTEGEEKYGTSGSYIEWDEENTTFEHTDKYVPETKPAENNHTLRSRVKFEIDKKKLDWSPYVSVEFHNNLATHMGMKLEKVRTAVGTDYKINKHNSVGMAYIFTKDKIDAENIHALSISYGYKF